MPRVGKGMEQTVSRNHGTFDTDFTGRGGYVSTGDRRSGNVRLVESAGINGSGNQIVCSGDGMDVSCHVQVKLVHRNHLRVGKRVNTVLSKRVPHPNLRLSDHATLRDWLRYPPERSHRRRHRP